MSTLIIPIDASQISEKERGQQKVKVAVREGGKVSSQTVSVEAGGAQVRMEVDYNKNLEIAVGPANASDDDIFRLRTLTASVSPRQWEKDKSLTLTPIAITPIFFASSTLNFENGNSVAHAIRKMIVMAASRMSSAISFGVFWRFAPSTSEIM